MKAWEQFRIINDPKNAEVTDIPSMPLLVVLDNGLIGEARTIRGAVALIVGKGYYDAEDALDEWHDRIEAARREAMKAVAWNQYAVVYDERKGIIQNNYAADPEDPDYEVEVNDPPIQIRVDNERMFLISLMQLGSIKVFERENSYLMRPHEKWITEGRQQRCGNCRYQTIESKGEFICPVYNEYKNIDEGRHCSSFGIRTDIHPVDDEHKGGTYIDIANEYDLVELINTVGQSWIIDNKDLDGLIPGEEK